MWLAVHFACFSVLHDFTYFKWLIRVEVNLVLCMWSPAVLMLIFPLWVSVDKIKFCYAFDNLFCCMFVILPAMRSLVTDFGAFLGDALNFKLWERSDL